MKINKPEQRNDFYFSRYINIALENDLISSLEASEKNISKLYESLNEEQGNHSYQDGKWTTKEVLAHCIDTERILAYRALCFSRKEENTLPGFEQDDYAKEDNGSISSISMTANSFLWRTKSMRAYNTSSGKAAKQCLAVVNISSQGLTDLSCPPCSSCTLKSPDSGCFKML